MRKLLCLAVVCVVGSCGLSACQANNTKNAKSKDAKPKDAKPKDAKPKGVLGPQAEASASSISAVLKGVFAFLDPSADEPDLGADVDPKVKSKKVNKEGVYLGKPSSTLAVPPGGEVEEKADGEEDPNPKVDNEVVLFGKRYLSLDPTKAVPSTEKKEGVLFGRDYSGIVPPGIKLEMAKRAKAKIENDRKEKARIEKETKEREEREAAEKYAEERRARGDVLNYVLDTKEEKQLQMAQTLEMVEDMSILEETETFTVVASIIGVTILYVVCMKRRKLMAVKGLLKKMEVKVSDEYDHQTDYYDINPLNNTGEAYSPGRKAAMMLSTIAVKVEGYRENFKQSRKGKDQISKLDISRMGMCERDEAEKEEDLESWDSDVFFSLEDPSNASALVEASSNAKKTAAAKMKLHKLKDRVAMEV
eukprot:CAMPEP_0198222994 /NCGR_PEP_ID=MMETSP1445-20131203/90535_1 /TAXON_ID=36898 /ORGANISM="Pyramimonas sp., Strain CCMP2087" /LENGTH=418 /DNA_ID=CAMNT_0043901693 /DNA_START=169 /DNA_END=1425 /DNA_ORIENTATION=+